MQTPESPVTTAALANWNGQEMPLADVRVSVLDRGFLFGDSVYEVVRVYGGKPFHFDEHIQRLGRNLQKLSINVDVQVVANRALATLIHSGLQEATIYFQMTRGEAKRTHAFPAGAVQPNELIYVQSYDDGVAPLRAAGAKAILLDDIRWKRCDLKSTNLLANCLGAEQARQAGAYEAIFVSESGELLEGTRTSLFAVQDGSLLTTPLGSNILPGITRRLVLELAESTDLKLLERPLHRDELSSYEELFVTGTTTEIMPVISVDEQAVGTGQVGPIVKTLQAAYRQMIREFVSKRETIR